MLNIHTHYPDMGTRAHCDHCDIDSVLSNLKMAAFVALGEVSVHYEYSGDQYSVPGYEGMTPKQKCLAELQHPEYSGPALAKHFGY